MAIYPKHSELSRARLAGHTETRKFYSRQELIEKFSLDTVGKAPSVFNPEKLHVAESSLYSAGKPGRLANLVLDLLKKDGAVKPGHEPDIEWFKKLVRILTERSHTLVEMKTGRFHLLSDEITIDEKAKAKQLTPDVCPTP